MQIQKTHLDVSRYRHKIDRIHIYGFLSARQYSVGSGLMGKLLILWKKYTTMCLEKRERERMGKRGREGEREGKREREREGKRERGRREKEKRDDKLSPNLSFFGCGLITRLRNVSTFFGDTIDLTKFTKRFGEFTVFLQNFFEFVVGELCHQPK